MKIGAIAVMASLAVLLAAAPSGADKVLKPQRDDVIRHEEGLQGEKKILAEEVALASQTNRKPLPNMQLRALGDTLVGPKPQQPPNSQLRALGGISVGPKPQQPPNSQLRALGGIPVGPKPQQPPNSQLRALGGIPVGPKPQQPPNSQL